MQSSSSLFTSSYFRLEQVAEGIYAAIVIDGMGAWGNAGIVDLGDQTLVFDTFFTPTAATSLREAAEQITQRPVNYVINSHRHADHVFGNQVFSRATIITTEQTRQLMKTRNPVFKNYEHPSHGSKNNVIILTIFRKVAQSIIQERGEGHDGDKDELYNVPSMRSNMWIGGYYTGKRSPLH